MLYITASSLYRETINFFRNQWITITLMAILTSLITVILNHVLLPYYTEQLQFILGTKDPNPQGISLLQIIKQLSSEQFRLLLHISAIRFLITLIGHTLMLGGVLNLISLVSAGKPGKLFLALENSLFQLPKLFGLLFLMTLLSQLGFIILIIPGVALTILLALSPIIMILETKSMFSAMQTSMQIASRYTRLVTPAVILWLIVKGMMLLILTFFTTLPLMIATAILNIIYNLINAVLTIYLYRFYMLLRN
ncbi:MAG: YciC family protein [Candidatus Dasytiphilus stammeri]